MERQVALNLQQVESQAMESKTIWSKAAADWIRQQQR